MSRTRRTLAILVCMTFVGCSNLAPTQVGTRSNVVLHIYSTPDTAPLVAQLVQDYRLANANTLSIAVETQVGSHAALLNRLNTGETMYFVSHYLPADTELWAAPLAQDALAIILNPENPVPALNTNDIRRLYQGIVKDWAEVGGLKQDVTLLSYDAGTDMHAEFERLVMGRRLITANALAIPSAEAALERIAVTPGGIAYIPYSQLNDTVRVIAVEGVLPDVETITSNAYPLRTTIFIIGLGAPQDTVYRTFIEWVQSEAGQQHLFPFAPLPR
jgi:ABC-type phosphate transport system substrate-binding protein